MRKAWEERMRQWREARERDADRGGRRPDSIADRKEGEGPKGGGLDAVATWPLFLIDWAIFFGATLDFVLSESGVALFSLSREIFSTSLRNTSISRLDFSYNAKKAGTRR